MVFPATQENRRQSTRWGENGQRRSSKLHDAALGDCLDGVRNERTAREAIALNPMLTRCCPVERRRTLVPAATNSQETQGAFP